jgi:hypothetical protein
MSRKKNRITKLITALGVVGLMIGFYAPRVYAQHNTTGLSTVNYTGRYACLLASDGSFYTAVFTYNPNGAGIYTNGTLIASSDAFVGGLPTAFCTYNINTHLSSYTVSGHGTGFESVTWGAAGNNGAFCPPSFVDNTAIALRNVVNRNGASIDAEISDGNLLGQGFAGRGYCLK